MMKNSERQSASFRDPSGFLFSRGGVLYRQINRLYAEDYSHLMDSGLYEKLVKAGLLVAHTEVDVKPAEPEQAFKVIQPEHIPFISYPYEWSFSQLKAAALTTLAIQKRAVNAGMCLKDSSAYNIQFLHGKPVLVDTLSFEVYQEGEPWVAYRQFCQHFLGPLALMAHRDVRLGQLLRVYIDGIPLDLSSTLLPRRTQWNLGLVSHIHLHARAQTRYAETSIRQVRISRRMSREALLGLVESLQTTIRKLTWKPDATEWGDYYNITNYSEAAFEHKKQLVSEWLKQIQPKMVWDLGANIGTFSRLAAEQGAYTVSFDIDPVAVDHNYQQVKSKGEKNLLPLILDLTNPSPAIGWHNRERASLLQRGPVDVVLALALVHHLAISNNLPFPQLVDFFYESGSWCIVEFVPKSDTQVQKLLRSREDIFSQYTREDFERVFKTRFKIHHSVALRDSERWLYLLERK